jgi:hypothetical protein
MSLSGQHTSIEREPLKLDQERISLKDPSRDNPQDPGIVNSER